MLRKLCAALATLALGLGLSVVAVAAPAAAADYPTGASANQPSNWQLLPGESCYKIEPVNTVPYTLPAPPDGRAWSKLVVKAGSAQSVSEPNAVFTTGLTAGAAFQHPEKDSISHLILCSVPQTTELDCTAASVYTGAALANGVHLNMTISQGGSSFQTSAYVDVRQAQDPVSESGLVMRVTPKSGPQIVLPITNAQKASGVFTYTYSAYLTGAWTVTWVQFNTENHHFTGALNCGTTPPEKFEVALYLYPKLDSTKPAAWENSGLQVFIASKPGTEWFTQFPGVLPPGVCGDAWGVQQDKVKNWAYDGTFNWPANIQYPTDNIGWPPIYDAKHDDLSTVIDVPDCPELAVPAAPQLTTVTGCGIHGAVTPVAATGVDYATVFDPDTGNYTVTATPQTDYYFANDDDQTIVYSGSVGVYFDCPTVVELTLAYVSQCVIYSTVQWSITNPSNQDVIVHYVMGGVPMTHLATPGVTSIGTGTVDSPLTITWGGSGGLAAGSATAVAPAPTPLAAGPSGWGGISGASVARATFPCDELAVPVAPQVGVASSCQAPGTVSLVQSLGVVWGPLQLNTQTGFYSATATPASGYFFMGDADQSITFTGTVPEPTRVCPTVLTRTGTDAGALAWFGAVLLFSGAALTVARRYARR